MQGGVRGSMKTTIKEENMTVNYLDTLYNLKDKNVVVTGAAGQLGREICKAYGAAGSYVIGVDKQISDSSTKKKDRAEYFEMDIADKNSVEKGFDRIYSMNKKPDILINNAGVSVFEPFKGTHPAVTAIAREPVTGDGRPVPPGEAVGLRIEKGGETLFFLVSFTPGRKRCGPIDSAER